jgi:hypothetical protein
VRISLFQGSIEDGAQAVLGDGQKTGPETCPNYLIRNIERAYPFG